jgi:hypothetical protein
LNFPACLHLSKRLFILLLYHQNKFNMGSLFDYINWFAVLVGAVAYFALGALWYSLLFKNKWIAYNKIDMNDTNAKKGVAATMFGSFVLMFVQSLAIAILASRMDLSDYWMSGVKLGALTGVCFCACSIGINYLYEKKPIGLWLINGGYAIAGNIIAAVIICMWQ